MFKWKDEFSVKNSEIDDQHKKLIEIGFNLSKIVTIKDGLDHYDEIIALLNELKQYTVYHFEHEEKLLALYGYEDLENHKEEHKRFVEKVIEMTSKDIDGNQKEITMDILMFIADWIERHIVKTDKKYSDFLIEKGLA